MSKEDIKIKEKKLLAMVESITQEHLNNEYKELSISLVKKLGRKHDVPFKRGKLEIWATAVVYAIGQINFLFDESFEPYLSSDELCGHFNTKKSTVSDKARKIRDMFNMRHYDEEFSTRYMTENNPFKDMVVTDNGLIVPKSELHEYIEEPQTTLLTLLAEKTGLDEETLKEALKNDLMGEKGDKTNDEEIELFLDMISNPIPDDMGDDLLDSLIGNDFSEDSSHFGEDDIELFDDYVIDESNPLETIEDYQRAIDLFRNTKGEKYFEEYKGHFWLMVETRPFMMHLM
ncbi:MAG: DUF6398 domain-containing protein, partial [Methanobrevibacter sp.]|nr:DUF6398 domain-containing protein [Methanobrevibacter sp.]